MFVNSSEISPQSKGLGFYKLAAIAVAFLLTTNLAVAGELCFSRAFSHEVGNEPYSVVARDINSDSNMDYIVANYLDNTISVHRTNALDSWQTPTVYNVGFAPYAGPTSVIAEELTGDQFIDLALTLTDGNAVGIMKGISNGRFLPPVYANAGSNPIWIDSGDLDGDGDKDLVTTDGGTASVSLQLNDGLGAFEYDTSYVVGLSPHCVLVRDFDNDLDADLLCVNRKSKDFIVLYNNGSGRFFNRTRFVTSNEPWNAISDDFDSDGDLDVMLTIHIQNTVEVFENDGSGHFVHHSTHAVGARPTGIIVADLDGDSLNDIAVTNYDGKSQSVLMNTGGDYAPAIESHIGGRALTLSAADHNHDGLMDLVFPLIDDDEVFINLSQSGLGFPSVVGIKGGYYSCTADVNGDYSEDVIAVNLLQDHISVTTMDFAGRPLRTFYFPTPAQPIAAVAEDLDLDGDVDIAVATISSQQITILANDGSGRFLQQNSVSTGREAANLYKGDFDEDGDCDLLLQAGVYGPSPGLFIVENTGNMQFVLRTDNSFTEIDSYTNMVTCKDLNGDGDLDLIVPRGKIAIYYGAEGLTFQPVFEMTVPGGNSYMAEVVDFDRDGDYDFSAVIYNTHRVTELVNDGSGGFTSVDLGMVPAITLFSEYSYSLDVDGNGWTDIVATTDAFLNFHVFLNDSGTFAAPQSVHLGAGMWGYMDAEGDGDEDLLFSSENSGLILISTNCSTPVYTFGDCNNDGKVDVSDAVFLINYIFADGGPPEPRLRGDINHDYLVNVSDIVRIVNYVFFGAPLE